ncbi:MAG: hypothetical protein NZ551_08030 [Microscillaceae bacterium]|nr:hypothetical protein [Microscillaceae bacterium]MDW8461145.1 hypothetical protein [Cytophagales bacterium]
MQTFGWTEFLILLGGLVGFFYFLGRQTSLSAGKRGADFIADIEQKYIQFASQSLSAAVLQNKEMDTAQLAKTVEEEALVILKPEVEALIAYINRTDASNVKIKYKAKVFKNLALLTEEFLEMRNKDNTFTLGKKEEDRLMDYLRDAIRANLVQLFLDFRLHRLTN